MKTPPFELTDSNELVYNGDQTRNLVNINENRQIFINRPGVIFTLRKQNR